MRLREPGTILAVAAWCLLVVPSPRAAIPLQEREALVTLYNSTNGVNWNLNSGWLGGEGSECGWYGVTCDPSQSTVNRITLGGMGLTGTLPSQIGNFTNLKILKLFANQLSGGIPPELGNLTDLQEMDLAWNQRPGA